MDRVTTKVLHGASKARPGEPLNLRCECCGSVLVARAVHLLDLPTGTVGTFGVDCAARLLGWIKPGERLGIETDKFIAEAIFSRITSFGTAVEEEGVLDVGARKYRFKRYTPSGRTCYRYSTARPEAEEVLVQAAVARGETVLWALFWGGATYIEVSNVR